MTKPYTLKKSLGQHFLHDENICRKIVAQLTGAGDLLEVGPGAGAITKYLYEDERWNYKAVELDEEKTDYLSKTFPGLEAKLLNQDFLKSEVPFAGLFTIIGNFPYNISGPILFKIYDWEDQVEQVVGMFQKEVAKRIASREGSREYGILSVLLQTFYQIEYLFDVAPGCFNPPPKVVSGVIRMVRNHNPYEIDNKIKFKSLVKAAFSQRRKKLSNALANFVLAEEIPAEYAGKRAEQLLVSEFANLYKCIFNK